MFATIGQLRVIRAGRGGICWAGDRARSVRLADPGNRATPIRGGVNRLMAEILEDHIRLHMMTPDREADSPEELGEDLIGLVRAYLK